MPLTYFFMIILRIDIYGFWLGMTVAEGVINIMFIILLQRLDFDAIAQIALRNVRLETTVSKELPNGEEIELLSAREKNTSEGVSAGMGDPASSLTELLRPKLFILLLFIVIFVVSLIFSKFSSKLVA